MRVIAGSARSLPLKTVEGRETRPTTDRIKETLFNILMPYLPGCRFLDLFAGSGAIGIEALSRGADTCVFVENSRKAAACIRENLQFTRLDAKARVIQSDVLSALSRLWDQKAFDLIFLDPPYGQQWEQKVLEMLARLPLADSHTLIVAEADLTTDFSWAEDLGFQIVREKKYKTNRHMFLQKAV